MLQDSYIFHEIGKRFTYWNATQGLKDFLILNKKTTIKNMVRLREHVLT